GGRAGVAAAGATSDGDEATMPGCGEGAPRSPLRSRSCPRQERVEPWVLAQLCQSVVRAELVGLRTPLDRLAKPVECLIGISGLAGRRGQGDQGGGERRFP